MLKNIDQDIKTIKKIKFKAERNVKMLKQMSVVETNVG
jgi:hypothetical protein